MPTQTLPPFNDGLPLRVVRLEDGRLGVMDDGMRRTWIEFDIESRALQLATTTPVALPVFPAHYGRWVVKSIGGVSTTVRRTGILRATERNNEPVVLFATNAPSSQVVARALQKFEGVSVGATQLDKEYGWVSEVVVVNAANAACVAAAIADTGAVPLFERNDVNACRDLAIERLDRIGASVVTTERMVDKKDGLHGLRRGSENWNFKWVPPGWEPPITWDHMVRNVASCELHTLPQPLRQHVAQWRLDREDHPPIGTEWTRTAALVPQEVEWHRNHPGQCAPYPLRSVIDVEEHQRDDIENGFDTRGIHVGERDAHFIDGVPRVVVLGTDGAAYAPVDTRASLRRHVPRSGRYVSAALSTAQSKQLLECFYHFSVAHDGTEEQRHGMRLVMFHYMKERGYTARWLGKYEQDGQHVGNGDTFRRFSSRLSQYEAHRLPAEVLNQLCGRDGRLRNRGSKGSRSKYIKSGREQYAPKRRMQRSRSVEESMLRQ